MSQPVSVCYGPEECAWCLGRGRERDQNCPVCKGRGAVLAAQPARPCRSCAGTGRGGLIEERRECPSCGGAGWDGTRGRAEAQPAVPPLAHRARRLERRASPRAPLLLPVSWGRSGKPARPAETGDLSPGGCFVMTAEPVRVGERVVITLPCEATAGLRVAGEIAYRAEMGFGVRFCRMPESARSALALLLGDYYRDLERAGRRAPAAHTPPAFRVEP